MANDVHDRWHNDTIDRDRSTPFFLEIRVAALFVGRGALKRDAFRETDWLLRALAAQGLRIVERRGLDTRVAELLEANNRYLARAREAEAAIDAERERCAQIADDYDQAPGDDTPMGPLMAAQVAVAQAIAAKIREGA